MTHLPEPRDHEASFAETALKLGGKSDDEARRTGAIDAADDQVEALFAPQYQTVSSPAHRAVWDRHFPVELFHFPQPTTPPEVQQVMDAAVDVVRRHKLQATLRDEHDKLSEALLNDLGEIGYWGLLVDKRYGGTNAPFASFAPFLTRMATIDPTAAGLASVHGCIGAVDPVSTFGTAEQQERFLPGLASGERLSAFALTEPCAGSDLTALRTTAVRDGDSYLVTGEKLFITNTGPGRTIGLVCRIDDEPAVLVVELPAEESVAFRFRDYGLWALKHTHNRGMVFNNFRVPAENRLVPPRGDGLTIAYHGLNLGRVALCANAAGTMRTMLAGMIPWAHYRVTYSEAIAQRELVRRRLGEMAGLIVACDALVAWCAGLIDAGYRGEMECIVAKVFGSEAQKHAAIELCMKTHGGRAFLKGHAFGDNVHEFLAPCIYEGEGEMLSMAFFKSLVKHHGKTYFEPVGKKLAETGIKKPNLLNPSHVMALAGVAWPYAKWRLGRMVWGPSRANFPSGMSSQLCENAQRAAHSLQQMAVEISSTMSRHQLKLADRQCSMAELSLRCQRLITVLVTSLYAADQENEAIRTAAEVFGEQTLAEIAGRRPSGKFYRRVTQLGEAIADGAFPGLSEVDGEPILMRYD